LKDNWWPKRKVSTNRLHSVGLKPNSYWKGMNKKRNSNVHHVTQDVKGIKAGNKNETLENLPIKSGYPFSRNGLDLGLLPRTKRNEIDF